MADSTAAPKKGKPRRKTTRKDFPLWKHPRGYWCKKVNQRPVYFEKVADDPDGSESLVQWLDQKDDLIAGREPRHRDNNLRLKGLCDRYLTYKAELVASGELIQRTLDGYTETLQTLCDILGKTRSAADIGPDDFAKVRASLAKRYKPVTLTNKIQTIRSAFKYGYDAGLLDKPARFGLFKKPRAKVIRESRIAKGDQDFTAEEILKLLEVASINLRAMILLGVQAGFGNLDCAELTIDVIDFETGWLDWPRKKTATRRRVCLWPETLEAIKAAVDQHDQKSGLVFMGRRGVDYLGNGKGGYRVASEFKRIVGEAGVRKRGFYCLRRTFQTVAEDCRDLAAVKSIMGHIPPENDMSARYRQRISDDRLKDVTDHVHTWLYGKGGAA